MKIHNKNILLQKKWSGATEPVIIAKSIGKHDCSDYTERIMEEENGKYVFRMSPRVITE